MPDIPLYEAPYVTRHIARVVAIARQHLSTEGGWEAFEQALHVELTTTPLGWAFTGLTWSCTACGRAAETVGPQPGWRTIVHNTQPFITYHLHCPNCAGKASVDKTIVGEIRARWEAAQTGVGYYSVQDARAAAMEHAIDDVMTLLNGLGCAEETMEQAHELAMTARSEVGFIEKREASRMTDIINTLRRYWRKKESARQTKRPADAISPPTEAV